MRIAALDVPLFDNRIAALVGNVLTVDDAAGSTAYTYDEEFRGHHTYLRRLRRHGLGPGLCLRRTLPSPFSKPSTKRHSEDGYRIDPASRGPWALF